MIRYENSVTISKPVKGVYDYMTMPGNWIEHLPCTVMVDPALKQAPAVGEKVRETLSLFGIRLQIDWVIIQNDCPTHYAIRGITSNLGGGTSHLTYLFSEQDQTTFVERRITYTQNSLIMRLLEPIGRLYFIYEGKQALKKAREILEAMPSESS